MNRYFPTTDSFFGIPIAVMEEDSTGDYVRVEDVVEFLKSQRNDIAATGFEFANGFLYEIGGDPLEE